MADLRRFSLADWLLLLTVLGVAAGTRAWYLSAGTDNGNAPGPLRVEDAWRVPPYPDGTVRRGRPNPTELDDVVHHLQDSRSFKCLAPLASEAERTAHRAPGYPALMALLEGLTDYLGPADRTGRWLQCVLGALTAGFYFLFARRAFRNLVVATLAGLFCALHPFWVANTAEINDGVLASFLMGACLALGARAGQIGGPLTSWLFGLAAAALALVRAPLLPFAFVAMLWFLWRCRSLARGWMNAFLAFLGFATGLVPWTVQNYRAFQEVIPVVDSAWLHLWIGNNPGAMGGPMSDDSLQAVLAKEPDASPAELAKLPQPERYRKLAAAITREISGDPAASLRRRLRAGLYFFMGEHWFHSGELWQATAPGAPEAALPPWLAQSYPAVFHAVLLGMLLLGVLGWRWTALWRWEAMPSSLAVIWIPLPYLLSHAGSLAGPRLPLDGVLLTYSAFALVYLLPIVGNPLRAGSAEASDPYEADFR